MKLLKKTVLLVGSGVIGYQIGIALANQGADLAICDISVESMSSLAKEIEKIGSKAITIKTNVTNDKEVKNAVNKTVKEFGKVDIFIYTSAIFKYAPIVEMKTEDWILQVVRYHSKLKH